MQLLIKTRRTPTASIRDTGFFQVSFYQATIQKIRSRLIISASGVAHMTIQNSSVTKNAANHATHHLYVTKQKDSEERAAHAYNSLDLANPPVDFAKYFDGESLLQEDM